jgi:hypothetical protein
MRDWYRDPKSDPDAKEHRERPQRRKKDTRRWCKGKLGRKHKPGIVFDDRFQRPCAPAPAWAQKLKGWWWMCHHIEICTVCKKHLRWYVPKEECPTWKEQHRED